MNRKQFLKHCACTLCSCAAVGMIAPGDATAAENAKPDDWRLPFIKKQYTYEMLLGKKVEVELKESVLRSGKRCTTQICVPA
jgi:hypothetical protein